MASKYWIKLYHEIVDDPKMGQLPDHLWRRCIELFLIAGEHNQSGQLPNLDDTAWRLRTNSEMLEAELNDLARFGITNLVDGAWQVTKFRERQGKPYSMKPDAIRQRNYRADVKKEREERKREDIDTDTDVSRDMSRDTVSRPHIKPKLHGGVHYELPPEDVPHYQHNEQRRLIISALSSVCRETFAIGDDDQERAADALIEIGATEDDIIAFGPYWDKKEDKPDYTGKPYLKSLMQNIKESMTKKSVASTVNPDGSVGKYEPDKWSAT